MSIKPLYKSLVNIMLSYQTTDQYVNPNFLLEVIDAIELYYGEDQDTEKLREWAVEMFGM